MAEPAAEKVSIKQRIVRQFVRNVAAVSVAGVSLSPVEAWDARGNSSAHLSAVVYSGNERAEESGTWMTMTREILVIVLVAQSEADTDNTQKLLDRWIAAVRAKVMSDRRLVEAVTAKKLANQIHYRGATEPHLQLVHDQPEAYAAVAFEVETDEVIDDPYAGHGVTELNES